MGMKELKSMTKAQKLDYYCNLNNIVTIATGNTKLGSMICGLSLPAGVTCRTDAPCRKFCYCTKGFQICSSVLFLQKDALPFCGRISNMLKCFRDLYEEF